MLKRNTRAPERAASTAHFPLPVLVAALTLLLVWVPGAVLAADGGAYADGRRAPPHPIAQTFTGVQWRDAYSACKRPVPRDAVTVLASTAAAHHGAGGGCDIRVGFGFGLAERLWHPRPGTNPFERAARYVRPTLWPVAATRNEGTPARMPLVPFGPGGVLNGAPATQFRVALVIARPGYAPHTVDDLQGKRIAVVRNSIYQWALRELASEGRNEPPVVVGPSTPLEELVKRIEDHRIDVAIVDAGSRAGRQAVQRRLAGKRVLPPQLYRSWKLVSGDSMVRHAVAGFLHAYFSGDVYDALVHRYFGPPRVPRYLVSRRISPYDDLVRIHAEAHDFDWRLIVAQMRQESQFNPTARSSAGALGLMQLLPSTAAAMGVDDPFDPAAGIRGGVKYLGYLRDRFDDGIAPDDRKWFALAAYHGGFARIEFARRIAAARGLDPNRWFGQVERVVLSMGARDPNCGCAATVAYVRAIRAIYSSYHLQGDELTADAAHPGRGKPLS